MNPATDNPGTTPPVRCAIYTRKSTQEGLDEAFTSLDAQRQAAEAYILSQQQAGWRCLPEHYDDGGYSGSNLERPALQRLLADIQAGKLDCLVVAKVDRLSRSLLDFAKLIEVLDRHQVAFVSVTQLFNTATSMGRLVLHILLSFAQFERELIAERTRDKIAAARRQGHWAGGMPLLGYDVDGRGGHLVVNPVEAERVRAIFAFYRQEQDLGVVVEELARRGWVKKRWQTRKGDWRGGQPFTTASLRRLLTNVTYRGQVRYRDEVHAGAHPALIDAALWDQVQTLLRRSGTASGSRVRHPQVSFLHGILRCVACDCAMVASFSRKGTRCYRYYVCRAARKHGWKSCPAPCVSAGTIERLVLEQLVRLDPQALAALGPGQARDEQARLMHRLLQRVDYDPAQGKLVITLQADHATVLAEQNAARAEEAVS
ncbi:MAG TPA: recombinase family protein [Gemmataceae bacterium]|nr:recombinase family protein [Gemmataceae bacterium]